MSDLVFTGGSDDLVQIDPIEEFDEINVLSLMKGWHAGYWDLFHDGAGVRVHAVYDGCWTFAVGLVAEDIPAFDPFVRYKMPSDTCVYSTALLLTVPVGTVIVGPDRSGNVSRVTIEKPYIYK